MCGAGNRVAVMVKEFGLQQVGRKFIFNKQKGSVITLVQGSQPESLTLV